MRDPELLMHRRQTASLLRQEGSEILLERSATAETAAGGVARGVPMNIPPQPALLVPARSKLPELVANSSDNTRIAKYDWLLVMLPDADVEEGDEFSVGVGRYTVMALDEDRRWQILAGVEQRRLV